eukprot:11201162-Lingulodinium_polyedra.AAC.1
MVSSSTGSVCRTCPWRMVTMMLRPPVGEACRRQQRPGNAFSGARASAALDRALASLIDGAPESYRFPPVGWRNGHGVAP